MWTLRAIEPCPAGPVAFHLFPGAVKTLGRAVRADFILEAPLVSRFHCRLSVSEDGALAVEDLDSTNGTYVNGSRVVERLPLQAGDRLKVGRVELEVRRGP